MHTYTYILWDISSFNSGWRVDWYRSGESNISIYISWDSRAFWSMESFGSSPMEIGWFLPGEEGRIFLVVIRGFARCPSLFDSKHGGAHMGVGRMQRLPPRLKQIFTEQLFTQRSETATKCTDINSISHPRSKDTPFVNRYRIIPSVSLSRNFDPDLNNNALIKICRKQIFPTRRWTRNTPSFYFLSFLSLSPPSRKSS